MAQHKPITLIATIGSSPAVLTEAVYALHKKGQWPITEVVIITTAHGVEKIKEGLFGASRIWIKLCDELGINPHSINIPSINEISAVIDEDGNELNDIRNSADDTIMAAHIQQCVREYTKDDQKRVFALLSGGRKTMSSHLMSAMQLFARRDDRLFHILVSEPYENIHGFYFPTSESQLLEFKTKKGDVIGTYDAKDAEIDLIDIPFIRLRPFLERQIDYSKSFDELIAVADEKLQSQGSYPVHDLHLHLNGSDSMVYVNGMEYGFKLEPRQMSIFALYCWLNIQQGLMYDVAWKDVVVDPDRRQALHIFYRTARYGNFKNVADDETRTMNLEDIKDEWLDYDYWFDKADKPIKRSLNKELSVMRKTIRTFLKEKELNHLKLEHLFMESGSDRLLVKKLFKVPVPPKNCRITGLHPDDEELLDL